MPASTGSAPKIGAGDLGAAAADQPGQPDDLARADSDESLTDAAAG